jgi:hypothetical protein
MTESDYLATKIITLEVILESLIEELENSKTIDGKRLDNIIFDKLNKLREEIDIEKDVDYPNLFMGPIGEA